jgi:DNA processing protein
MLSRRERLILLNTVPNVTSLVLRRLLDAFGDLDALWAAGEPQLRAVPGLGPQAVHRLLGARTDERRLERELALAHRGGVTILTVEEEGYPQRLREIPDPPLALYVRGALAAQDATAIAIVGSRRASAYGLQSAERLGYDLALRGLTVVSGLAVGIDGAAHAGALRAGGRTVAVLGSGFCRLYPPEHEELAERIAGQGAVISEYPMEAAPLGLNFPRRNRLISGLSLGVVVVEAARRSGALITADCALEQGREVFAVPGPVTSATSQGTHQLVKEGARLATSVEDVLEELGLPAPARLASPSEAAGAQAELTAGPARAITVASAGSGAEGLAAEEREILACVGGRPRTIDAIAAESRRPAADVSSALLRLELKRLVRQLPGKQFIRLQT